MIGFNNIGLRLEFQPPFSNQRRLLRKQMKEKKGKGAKVMSEKEEPMRIDMYTGSKHDAYTWV